MEKKRGELERLQKASNYIVKAAGQLDKLSLGVRSSLLSGGGLTVAQLEAYQDLISNWANYLHGEILDTRGGKNWDALIVAFNIAELFLNIKRKVTFGHVDGAPTTDFGRAVEFSLAEFGIEANWRSPAQKAASALTENK